MGKTYKTHNLNEATYLIMSGCEPNIKKTGIISSEFTFERTKLFEKHRATFWTNSKLTINLNKWLMARQELKNELTGMGTVIEATTYKGVRSGEAYWFVSNGAVLHAMYGKGAIHQKRIKDKNFFLTRSEAQQSL